MYQNRPEGIRTPDPVVRSHVLYSPELQTYEPILTKSDKTVNYL